MTRLFYALGALGIGTLLYSAQARAEDPDDVGEQERALVEDCVDAQLGVTRELNDQISQIERTRRGVIRRADDIAQLGTTPASTILEQVYDEVTPSGLGPNNILWIDHLTSDGPAVGLNEFVTVGADGVDTTYLHMVPPSVAVCVDLSCIVQRVESDPTPYLGSQNEAHELYFERGVAGHRICFAGLERSDNWADTLEESARADEQALELLNTRYDETVAELRSEIDTQSQRLDAWRSQRGSDSYQDAGERSE